MKPVILFLSFYSIFTYTVCILIQLLVDSTVTVHWQWRFSCLPFLDLCWTAINTIL